MPEALESDVLLDAPLIKTHAADSTDIAVAVAARAPILHDVAF